MKMIKLFKNKIRRNYYKPFDRHAEIIDVLIQGFNLLSEKLDEVIAETNELEKEVWIRKRGWNIKDKVKGSKRKWRLNK